jgi:hypothetical protein
LGHVELLLCQRPDWQDKIRLRTAALINSVAGSRECSTAVHDPVAACGIQNKDIAKHDSEVVKTSFYHRPHANNSCASPTRIATQKVLCSCATSFGVAPQPAQGAGLGACNDNRKAVQIVMEKGQ